MASPKLALIAGGGSAPWQFLDSCRRSARDVVVICLEGQADEGLGETFPHIWVPLGSAKKLVSFVQEHQAKEIVMLGRVRRPSLSEIKPDFLAIKVLAKIGMSALGDDALLQSLGKAVEEETGARVVGAHQVFTELLTPKGVLTTIAPDESATSDIQHGITVAKELGRLDVGQAVVVQQGLVLGVEAIEGTDALIARSGSFQRSGAKGVLIKTAKPQQDHRYDLPAIGVGTVESASKAGLRGIAVEAGRSLMVDREKTIEAANAAGLFLIGIEVLP